jgi:hypothetical protein
MKKRLMIMLVTAVLLGTSGLAQARDHNRGHHDGYKHHGGHSNRYYGGRHYRGYDRRRGHSNPWGYVAGAIVLGSIIHSATHRPQREVVYRTRRTVEQPNYWYRVDADGNCVEVRLNSAGSEVWTYTDASYCE